MAWNAANAKGYGSQANVPIPDGTPPLASKKHKEAPIPRQVSQHHQLFEDIYQQVTPTDPFAGSRITRQMDMRDTDPMDMAQFANLNLRGASRNPFILDKTRPVIAANKYPETVGPEFVPSTPVVQIGRMNTIPLTKPSTKTAQAGNREIYDRYITTGLQAES